MSGPPYNFTDLSLLTQLVSNPEAFTTLRAALLNSMAAPSLAAATGTMAAPPASTATPSEGQIVGILNHTPISIATSSEPPTVEKSGKKSKKRARPAEQPPKLRPKPSRRSDRIPRQARKSGRAPTAHVTISDDETAESPPTKQARRCLDTTGVTIDDIGSFSPDPAMEKPIQGKKEKEKAKEKGKVKEKAKSPIPKPNPKSKEIPPEQQASPESDADDVSLTSLFTQAKREKIRKGKRPVVLDAEPAPKAAHDESSEEELFDDSDIDASKALSHKFYDQEATDRWEVTKTFFLLWRMAN